MNRGIIAALLSFTLAAGAVGYVGSHKQESPPAISVKQAAPEAVQARKTVLPAEQDEIPAGELRFRRLAVEAGGDVPEACLVFSAPLDASGAVRYTDYVGLRSNLKLSARIDSARLCLTGFPFGVDHEVTLRAGLPGAKGEKLAAAVTTMVGFGDRPASIAFGPGLILPRENPDGLPVTTVNVTSLKLKVMRVGDRLLARMKQGFAEERKFYSYELNATEKSDSTVVWSGDMPVNGPRNEAVVSLFPLGDVIGKQPPGAYLVVAEIPGQTREEEDEDGYYYRPPAAGQWVIQSDIGLTSFQGAEGLTVVARSLKTAKPLEGARLTLIARNNEELGQVLTDRDGKARFDPGLLRGAAGMSPVMVMAYAGSDYNFADLRRPAFDLSDRGVDGRGPSGPVDAFLYTERGIYRPGETVELVTLLRDPTVKAVEGTSAVIKVLRPDGKEYRRYTIKDVGAGSGHVSIPLPAAANRGNWQATVHVDPEGPAIGQVAFEVQDFVPQRLGLTIGDKPALLKPGQSLEIPVDGRFLYGAPASSLGGEAEMSFEPDPAPFPMHKGFRWGMEDEKLKVEPVKLEMADTDAAGKTKVVGQVPVKLMSSLPLRADLSIALREPGGRATSEHVMVPVRTRPVSLGIRPHFEERVREGQDAVFDLIAVDEAGVRVARSGVTWRLLRDVSTWQWYRSQGNWRYERIAREAEMAGGTVSLGAADAPQVLRQNLKWGSYRLLVTDPASGASTSMRFTSGWYGGQASAERPDRLKVASDKAGYAAGETARIHVESEFEGEALLVVANEKVHEVRSFHVPAGGADIKVPVQPEWGPGAYAMVTLYRPFTDKLGHAPVRGVGVAWLGLDPGQRTLAVSIGAPEKMLPRQKISVPVKVSGGERPFVTLAAVDQGILQLTRFKTPSPTGYFLAKRRLGIGMRDDYGRLIRGPQTNDGGQGGDSFGGKGLDVVPTRTVALFSGILPVDRNGQAVVELDIPDFQGELRLMAVAFDGGKVGSADARLTVRDPVVAEVILPRFLAPGDKGRATVLLHNVDGGSGDYQLHLAAHDAVVLGEGADRVVSLPKGKREVFTIPLDGAQAGIGSVEMRVRGPDNFSVARAWPIQVRPPQLPETRQMVSRLAPGEEVVLGADLLSPMMAGTSRAAISFSRWQGFDVPGVLRWLDRYPYGCLEQTTSRALPLLYYNDVTLLSGGHQDRGIPARIQDSIDRVLSMQNEEGAFRMWGQWGEAADDWLSVFALDFLQRAADKGFDVPDAPLKLGRRWLQSHAIGSSRPEVKAYAYALLAREGRANAGDLRYFFDSGKAQNPMALAHLGQALDSVGERARAAKAFETARGFLVEWANLESLAVQDPALANAKNAHREALQMPYGSRLRDTYGVVAALAAGGRGALVPAVLEAGSHLDPSAEATTTQEKAWMLMAVAELSRNSGKLAVEVDGRPVAGGDPQHVSLASDQLAKGVRVRNAGETELFRVTSVEGVPAEPAPASGNAITVDKQLFTLDGKPVDPQAVRRNDRMVVVLRGSVSAPTRGEYALLDLLPAGLEIEGVLRPDQPGYAWLGRMSEANQRQARDDRFAAALTLPERETRISEYGYREETGKVFNDFTVAYVVRAVTPGEFALPALVAEHMYKPAVKARSAMGRLVITE